RAEAALKWIVATFGIDMQLAGLRADRLIGEIDRPAKRCACALLATHAVADRVEHGLSRDFNRRIAAAAARNACHSFTSATRSAEAVSPTSSRSMKNVPAQSPWMRQSPSMRVSAGLAMPT